VTKPRILAVVLCVVVGAGWFGQGIGLISGSFMTGDPFWAAAGAILLLVAVGLVWNARERRRKINR
jgi:hypothetical protein